MTIATEWAQWAIVGAFFSALIFVAGMTALSRWWQSLAGRSMVSIDVALAIALAPATLHHLFAAVSVTSPFFTWYYAISLTAGAALTLWRLYAAWLIRRRGRARSRSRRSRG